MTSSDDKPTMASRGDLVVVVQHYRDWVRGEEPREYDTYTVGTVTSVTRDGTVKMFSEAGRAREPDLRGQADRGGGLPRTGFVRAYVMSSAKIDVAGALATAACRTWDGHATTRPYETLAEVQAALRPHLRTEPTCEPLHEAAERHAVARHAALQRYRADESSTGWDTSRYDAYTVELLAANREYLAFFAEPPEPAQGDHEQAAELGL